MHFCFPSASLWIPVISLNSFVEFLGPLSALLLRFLLANPGPTICFVELAFSQVAQPSACIDFPQASFSSAFTLQFFMHLFGPPLDFCFGILTGSGACLNHASHFTSSSTSRAVLSRVPAFLPVPFDLLLCAMSASFEGVFSFMAVRGAASTTQMWAAPLRYEEAAATYSLSSARTCLLETGAVTSEKDHLLAEGPVLRSRKRPNRAAIADPALFLSLIHI